MYPYQHSPSSGTPSSGPGPSSSQQFLGNVESAASRLKRAFGKKRSTRLGEDSGTQSEAPTPRKLVPGPRLSSFIPRKDHQPALQFANTFQSIGKRLNKSSSPRVVSYIEEPKESTLPRHSVAVNEVKLSPSSPLKVPSTPKSSQRASHLVPTSEISAAIDYMMDSTSSTNSPSTSPKATVQAEQVTPGTTRVARSGSFDAENAPPTKSSKRRSMSLSMIPVFAQPNEIQHVQATSTPPSSFSLSSKLSPSVYQPHHRSHSAIPTFPDTGSTSSLSAATPINSDHSNPETPRDKSSSSNLKDRLTIWAAAPPNQPRTPRGSSPGHSKTMSMVASLAPAANAATGLAVSFSRKAYEKVNSMWAPASSHSPQESGFHSARPSELSDSSLRGRKLHTVYGGSQSDVESSKRRMNPLTDQAPAPYLGPMLRPPFRNTSQGGGLLFGRPLVDCVRDTKALVVLGSEVDLGLEARFIPALVLRCVQHIERWGIVEEGLFRIAGRTSHINKIRSEFASGADYDLQLCGPGDLDPHAVSSVLKAFVRELPEPILTREMSPLFDAAFERAKESGFMLAGLPSPRTTNFQMMGQSGFRTGLPSNPRPVQTELPQLSLDTPVPEPDFPVQDDTPKISPEEALQTLLTEFRHLVSSLAKENQDLLLTMTELLDKVSLHSKLTKMPLSNLLLVLCPSMNMNPGVLKVLVEHHRAIFSGPNESDPVSNTGAADLQEGQYLQPTGLHDASSLQEWPRRGDQKETAYSSSLEPIAIPIPTNKLPVRKQSLRKHGVSLSARVAPASTPYAFKDVPQAQNVDIVVSEGDLSHSTPSTQAGILHGEMVRPLQPVGPRHPKVVPTPIKIRRHSSLSRDSPISPKQGLSFLPQPPATAPPIAQLHYAQHQTLSDTVSQLSESQPSLLQAQDTGGLASTASHHPITTEEGSNTANLRYKISSASAVETVVASNPEIQNLAEQAPLSVETSASTASQDPARELYVVQTDSTVSSATTEPNLLDQLGSWPEVPRTVCSTTNITEDAPRQPLDAIGSTPSLATHVDPTDRRVSPTTTEKQPVNGEEQENLAQSSKVALEAPSLDGQRPGVATNQSHTVQHQVSTMAPNWTGTANGYEENIADAAALTKQSAATAREAVQVSETKNMKPLQSHAPRLTVNSKEMLSGDSYWAKELQRAIHSTTPASPIDGRHSGEWANGVLNTAGL